MEFTLWRGDVLLGRAELSRDERKAQRLRGSFEPTDALIQLGAITQISRLGQPGPSVAQHVFAPQESSTSEGGDLDAVEIWVTSRDRPTSAAPSISASEVLELRNGIGDAVPTDSIRVYRLGGDWRINCEVRHGGDAA